MTAPAQRDRPIPTRSARLARSNFPAPMFWAEKADRDWLMAKAISMIKAQTFSATPTPAETSSPRLLAIARRTRKDTFTSRSERARGRPNRMTEPQSDLSHRMSRTRNRKGSFCFRIRKKDQITLTAWALTVAMAAPAAPRCRRATSSRSPTMLTTVAIATVISGVLESPMPRKMLPIRL